MPLSTPPALTQLKLDYLVRRRDELDAQYAEIERLAATGGALAAYERLAGLRSGAEKLHPEAASLVDVLALGGGVDLADRVAAEVASGRARAAYASGFAALVHECVRGREQPVREPSGTPVTGGDHPADLAAVDRIVDGVLAAHPEAFAAYRAALIKDGTDPEEAASYVTSGEVKSLLDTIANGPYRSERLRRAARAAEADDNLAGEYAGVLTLYLQDLDRWRWSGPVATRRVLAEGKVRTYLDEELLDLLFVDLVADRWRHTLGDGLVRAIAEELGKYRLELLEVLDRLPRSLAFVVPLAWSTGSSHYVGTDVVLDEPDTICKRFTCLHQTIQGLHALNPSRPVHVATTDVRAFGPSIDRRAILRVLERVGMPEPWVRLFGRILDVPVAGDRGRGIYPDQRLALFVTELAMTIVDLHVVETTTVTPIRVADDIALVAFEPEDLDTAVAGLRDALGAFGLELHDVNRVAAWGDAADARGRVMVGHLRLDADATWRIDDDAIAAATRTALAAFRDAASVLDGVMAFSHAIREALRKLIPFGPLGPEHLTAIHARLAPCYDELAPLLRARIAAAVEAATGRAIAVPDPVWYWPRTAGGLGLYDLTAQLAPIVAGWRKLTEPAPPFAPRRPPFADERDRAGYVSEFQQLVVHFGRHPLKRQPEPTIELRARIADFAIRGKDLYGVAAGKDEEGYYDLHRVTYRLNFYWQWVIAIRGPGLLRELGTFRFLEVAGMPISALTELGWLGARLA